MGCFAPGQPPREKSVGDSEPSPVRRSSEFWNMKYFATILIILGTLSCGAAAQTSGAGAMRPVVGEDPVEMLRTYLIARSGITGVSPVVVVCDASVAPKVTAAVQAQWVAASLVDSVMIDSTCSSRPGQKNDKSFRQYLLVNKVVTSPADSTRIETRAVMSFARYHWEYAMFNPKNRLDFRLVFRQFLTN